MPSPNFSDLGLSAEALEAVDDLGYTAPTPVQAQAIPYILEGRDLLAAAQTGTGKTAAFLLPTLSRLHHAPSRRGPLMLVVTPTRELAQQIEDVCRTVAARTRHKSVTVVGGVGYEPQKAALARGCDILVATPGRLVDLIDQGAADLAGIEVLVLDEADRMLDMGFLPSMRKIVAATPASRQTLLFSATLDEGAIGGIRDLVRDPAVVEIAHKGTVAETIDQYLLPVSLEAKNGLLAQVIADQGPQRVIVFTRTKHRADACCRRLRKAGISCAPIHGNRSQSQRERALAGFRGGQIDVLVATDVLARGIDVSDVRYVINFDVPADPEDYIHRIGRTGRAGETGWALTFVTVNDAEDLFGIERLMKQVVPVWERAGAFDLGEEPVELDPLRSAEPAPRGKKPGKKGSKGHAVPAQAAVETQGADGAEAPSKGEKPAGAKKTSGKARGGADTRSVSAGDADTPKKPRRKKRGGGRKDEGRDAQPSRADGDVPSQRGHKRKPADAKSSDGDAARKRDQKPQDRTRAKSSAKPRRRPGDRLGMR